MANQPEKPIKLEFKEQDLPELPFNRLEDIWGVLPTIDTIPTYTPARFLQQIVIVANGGSSRAYIYDTVNNRWF